MANPPEPNSPDANFAHLDTWVVNSVVDFAVIVTDKAGKIARWNSGAVKLFGWSAEEMLGQSVDRFFTPEDNQIRRPQTEMEQAVLLGRSQDERWHLRKNGERFWSSGEMMLLKDDNGTHVGYVKVISDRTAQKLAVNDVLQQKARLQGEVQARTLERDRVWAISRDLIAILDLQGVCQAANPGWQQELGYAEADLTGLSLDTLIHPDDLARAHALFHPTEDSAKKGELECRIRASDGRYHWFNWSKVIEDGQVLVCGRAISHLKKQQNALKLAHESLRQSQKMEAVGQLTGGIAHDFNNMLASVTGNLEMLQLLLDQGRRKGLARYVQGAMTAAGRAASLTQRLLAFSRRQTLDPQVVAVNPLVLSMEDLLRRTVGPQVILRTVLGAPLWKVLCDPHQLESALLNLVINSRDAMPEGGRLTIETSNFVLTPEQAVTDMPAGDYLRLGVSDTGQGMSQEVVERVLEPFFTTKPSGQGTGLGLSMTYAFVKQSQGHLRIRSELGSGTVIELFLPRHDGAEPTPQAESSLPDLSRLQGPAATVLLVEDDDSLRELTQDMLALLGYVVHAVEESSQALEWLAQRENLDVLLLDRDVGGSLDSRQLAQTVLRTMPAARLLFLTGPVDAANPDLAAFVRDWPTLDKPFSLHALADSMRHLLSASS